MKILIIDDEELIASALAQVAVLRGHEAQTAASGAEGLKLWQSWRPDILFLDLILPDKSGFLVMESLQDKNFQKIILMSAYGQYEKKSKEKGADLFLVKPFKNIFQTFDSALKNVLGGSAQQNSLQI